MTQSRCPLCIEREKLRRGVAHLLRRALLRLVPLAAAELVQRRLLGLRAAVAADDAELGDRNVELVAAFVLEQQELGLPLFHVQGGQTLKPSDAMLLMDHRVADLELREVAQHSLDRGAFLGRARAAPHHACVELRLGDDRPLLRGCNEAMRQRRDAEEKRRFACEEFLEARAPPGFQPVLGEVAPPCLSRARRCGGVPPLPRAPRPRLPAFAAPPTPRGPELCTKSLSATSGSFARRSAATGGSGVETMGSEKMGSDPFLESSSTGAGKGSDPIFSEGRRSIRAKSLARTKNSSAGTKSSRGARSGRSGSPPAILWRVAVSRQKSCTAALTSPCSARVVPAGR